MFEIAVLSDAVRAHGTKVVRKPLSGKILAIASHPGPNLASSAPHIKGEEVSASVAIDELEHLAVSAAAIRQQLARILQSAIFIRSERLSRFLRYIVEHVVDGNQNCLKEYVIGSEVYEAS